MHTVIHEACGGGGHRRGRGDGGIAIYNEVASLEGTGDGNTAQGERVVGVGAEVLVLFMAAVLSFIDSYMAFLPYVD